ncbi:MAG TPA: helix-turn-helix domain-containing protein [Ktedonobacteraceae bacterium]|nr:helix-turn-helix domain-containing protein [Ktedonobacteraceae bacterium]
MARRAQQAEERRIQLIDTALRVFAEKGWDATSIPDLAQAAGIAQGLMYHYFRNKEELLLAVVERHSFLPELQRLLAIAPDRPATQVLPAVAQGFAELLQQKRSLVQILTREAQTDAEIGRRLDALIEEGVTLLAGYVAARIDAHELRPHQPSLTARSLLYTIFMSQLVHVPAQAFVSDFVHYLLEGIRVDHSAG